MKKIKLSSVRFILAVQWQTSPWFCIWSGASSLIDGLRPIASAYILARLLATVSEAALRGGDGKDAYTWLALLMIIEVLYSLNTHLSRIFRVRFEQQISKNMHERMFLKLYQLSQEQFDDEEFNTLTNRAFESVVQVWRIVNEISWALSAAIGFLGSMIAIVAVSPWIGLAIIISSVPITLMQLHQNKLREDTYKKIEPTERMMYRSRWILTDTQYMPEVRLLNAFDHLIKNWQRSTTKTQDILHQTDRKLLPLDILADIFQPLISFVANIYFLRLLLLGSLQLDRFIFLRSMLEQAANNASRLTDSVRRLHEVGINLDNFAELYNLQPAIPNGTVKVAAPLTIEFKNVSFHYPNAKELALKDVSFLIVPGSRLALVGENGAGKSTLIKLLLRQYLPTSGTIEVNGHDIREIDQESYYNAIGILSQDFLIVAHLTIRENLTLGAKGTFTDDEIFTVTDQVDASSFIRKLPKGLRSQLDSSFKDGSNLSGGQRQRLGVARTLLRRSDVMILDEPTSAIDAKAEYKIFGNIYKAHAGKTTLIVSHRFSTVRQADRIIVMEHGEITEYGSHEELLAYGKLYKEMFETQAEGYK